MSNYYESARTNYFHVKDEAAFRAFIDTVPGAQLYGPEKSIDAKKDGSFCVLFPDDGVPNSRYNEETDDYDDMDFMEELAPHLADYSVAVLTAAGAEKLRYVNGYAIAVDSKGKQVSINLQDIYQLASKAFDKDSVITFADY